MVQLAIVVLQGFDYDRSSFAKPFYHKNGLELHVVVYFYLKFIESCYFLCIKMTTEQLYHNIPYSLYLAHLLQ